jgi:acetaldehyde dehydrogenase
MKGNGRMTAAVLGAGIIGADLASKIARSNSLDLRLVAGRDGTTPALRRLAKLGLPVATDGIRRIIEAEVPFDVVFDATNAMSHAEHAELLKPLGTTLIDLTPSKVGRMVVPTINVDEAPKYGDISMVSCGGQASIPILHAIARRHRIEYIEVVTTAASMSIGRSTRLNIDEYIETTEDAIRGFTGVENVKAILNISPASPPAVFRVAMSMLGSDLAEESVRTLVAATTDRLHAFVGGFDVMACTVDDEEAFVAVGVSASGHHIPRYAGNLDIINSAAVHIAERCV